MSAAMMLPTTLSLIRLFDRMIAGRRDSAVLHGLLIAGYLLAWSGFGIAAHIMDWSLHRGLNGWEWLAQRPWVPSAMVLAFAGAFQFSSFKLRSVLHVANALAELDGAGIRLYCDREGIDSSTPMGRAMIQMA